MSIVRFWSQWKLFKLPSRTRSCVKTLQDGNGVLVPSHTFRRYHAPSTSALPKSWQVRSNYCIGWTSHNFTNVEEGEIWIDSQTRKASTILWSSVVKLKPLLEVQGIMGDPNLPSNVKDIKPELVIPWVSFLYTWIIHRTENPLITYSQPSVSSVEHPESQLPVGSYSTAVFTTACESEQCLHFYKLLEGLYNFH